MHLIVEYYCKRAKTIIKTLQTELTTIHVNYEKKTKTDSKIAKEIEIIMLITTGKVSQ
jgi:hypothetical protein